MKNTDIANVEMQVGMIIKAKDFGHLDTDYIIGKVVYVNQGGEIQGIIQKRVIDSVDVTADWIDERFGTVQNGISTMDQDDEPRLSLVVQ
jgi:hypothetical protein|tara:strand:- start:135 stop:404 length:270 start_codon:yes stop_codon:yes gene_type:complete